MLRIKARIEAPTGYKDLVRIEEVTIVLSDEALAEIVKVVASQQSVQLTGATCPTHNEPVSDLIHYECGCSTTRPRN